MFIMRAFLFSSFLGLSRFSSVLLRRSSTLPAFLGSMTLVLTASSGRTEELHFTSGSQRTALIELFSSEGCSSCPPAERWLGDLRSAPGLWRDFVPVAFHVDYWNRLGWPDRFSTREFTQRQYTWAQASGNASVYTPCFVRDGLEWKPGAHGLSAGSTKAGVLSLRIGDDGACRAEYAPLAPGPALEVHVAVLGGGFLSKVSAGENRGETLPQEFVALALADHALSIDGGLQHAEFPLPRPKITGAPRRAVAVWITRRGEFAPLQATGGWLR